LSWRIPSKSQSSKSEVVSDGDWLYENHIIQKDEALYAIAERYGIDIKSERYRELLRVNNIDNEDDIRVGGELKIPMVPDTP
jgi:LysM repeat protein